VDRVRYDTSSFAEQTVVLWFNDNDDGYAVCSNTGAWTQVSFDMTAWAGQTIVLWFNDHDDGYATDPTYFLLDDVSLSGG
jgi:bacillopeptidase F (M6 metalloprotease family)